MHCPGIKLIAPFAALASRKAQELKVLGEFMGSRDRFLPLQVYLLQDIPLR